MGFAGKKLSADRLIAIASRLFVVRSEDKNRGELIGICPLHEDHEPSFAYNYQKDVFNCAGCQENGDLVTLWSKIKGLDPKDGFRDFCSAHDIKGDFGKPAGRSAAGSPDRTRVAPAVGRKTEPKEVPIIDESIWDQMKPLPDSFIKRLEKVRGWSREVIERLDLRLQTVYLDKDGKTIKQVERACRVAIPVRNDIGFLVNIRLYKPGAKVRKIISWGKGYGTAQLFPSGGTLAKDAPVFLCEGEPDTICALSQSLNAITQTSKLVNWPEWQLQHFKDKDVVIVYDADAAGEEYQHKAALSLSGTAKKINCLTWPEFMGCIFGYWPLKHGEDLTDFFVTHGKETADLFRILEATGEYIPPDNLQDPDNSEAEKLLQEPKKPIGGTGFFHLNNQGRWTFVSRWLADRLCKDTPLLFEDKTGLLYCYNKRHWDVYSEEHLESTALKLLGDESSSARAADSAKQAKLLSIMSHGREVNDTGLSCLENGMLNIKTLEMVPHAKKHLATYMLPISFNKKTIKKCNRWLDCLDETIETTNVIMQAQEFAGYCMTKETRFGKCLFLLGDGSDGKSLFIKVLIMLVGKQNTSAVAINDLENEFYRSSIYNKLLNVSTEISKKYFDSSLFKAIVTGDTISASFKNKDPFEFEPFCKMIFAGNQLPRVRDTSDGFYRRVLPIQFKKQFFGKDDDTKLIGKLEAELSEIYKWALTGLHRLWDQNGFTQSTETDELLSKYRRDNNPVLAFIETKCVLKKSADVTKDDIYKKYRDYCGLKNYKSLNDVHFFRELKSSMKTLKKELKDGRRKRDDNGYRPATLKGIGLMIEIKED